MKDELKEELKASSSSLKPIVKGRQKTKLPPLKRQSTQNLNAIIKRKPTLEQEPRKMNPKLEALVLNTQVDESP